MKTDRHITNQQVQAHDWGYTPAGNREDFEELINPHHNELLVHCYRILGSFEDAEDMVQETLVRAWKRLDTLEERSSLRAWLYKIATNVCLDALDTRKRRGLPQELNPRGDPSKPLPAPLKDVVWVEPFPDEMIEGQPNVYPEAHYEIRESITLAFVAALQRLPGRQRAVLLLRDVMGWNANETAETLGMTVASINSALQRARQTIKKTGYRPLSIHLDEQLSSLLARYVTAWETADTTALVATLREDVALTMPPFPVWFCGRADVKTFLDGYLFKSANPFHLRLRELRANGSPAFAVYQMDSSGVYRAAALHILTVQGQVITEINDFLTFDEKLFQTFNLPLLV